MIRLIGPAMLVVGLIFALFLIPVGAILTIFGFARYVLEDLGVGYAAVDIGIPGQVVVYGVMLGLVALHAVPLMLFAIALSYRRAASRWLGAAMVVSSPFVAWIGADGLLIRGDWGDMALWLPYLLSGILLATTGMTILLRRMRK